MPLRKIEDIDEYCDFHKKIASTSKANIWLCQDRKTGENMIVKELSLHEVSKSQQEIDHVYNERAVQTLLTSIKFPRSPALFATGKSDSSLFFVMELIRGAPMHLHLQQKGLGLDTSRRYFAEALSIIEFLHNKGIVYRDVKLSNLLLRTSDGRICICDFGHAKLIGTSRTRTICGTVHAMAPEVLKGEEYSYECDFWSLGVLLFELIEGIPPFGNDRKAVMVNILTSPESIQFSDRQSAESRELISRLLQPDKNNRISLFDEIRNCAFFAGKSNSWWEQAGWDASGENDSEVPYYDKRIADRYIFGRREISRTMAADDVFCDF